MKSEFNQLAQRFRQIQAVDDADGEWHVMKLAAQGAREVKRLGLEQQLQLNMQWPDPLANVSKENERWTGCWVAIADRLHRRFPDLVPLDAGIIRIANAGGGASLSRDWKKLALEYANVCEWLGEHFVKDDPEGRDHRSD